ncbi:hypothetical protein Peur_046199 [Populus x canadensis]
MCSTYFVNMNPFVSFVIWISLFSSFHSFHASRMQCNVSLNESCPASLYYVPNTMRSLDETASLFNVDNDAVKRTIDGFLVMINCSCLAEHRFFTWHMDYKVQKGDTWNSISSKFGFYVVAMSQKVLIPSVIVTLDVLCGCSNNADMVTYKVQNGDTVFTICSRFKANETKTVLLNGLDNPDSIHERDILFIPTPAGFNNLTSIDYHNQDMKTKKTSKSRIFIVVGAISAALVVVLLSILLVFWKNHMKKRARQPIASSRRLNCLHCYLASCPQRRKFEESMVSSIGSDKATVLPYNEIREATSNFSRSLIIGQGSYGLVYLGKLRGTDVAIKQMKDTNSKEFLSELNILCKVHHINLIELIGYAAGGESLFLVYEFAQNGALSNHLHNPALRGHKPLPWATRVQIALDAAKGLEYIHEHTKPYYVHRDIKPSNILLDSNFHAKIADFGLVKLLEQSPDAGGAAASRIVGTFGYLAPEYVRDGHVTAKSDVYSFGVVLMELLTGQPALSKDASPENEKLSEHRSVVQYMLSALNDSQDSFDELAKCIDPNLTSYDKDSLYEMALLSKDCVDDNWKRRPDMSRVVLRLSHMLSSSREGEEL